jgi:hypothetical protein
MATIDIAVESGVASALLDTVAPKDSPTFSGNVFLPSTTTIGSVSSTEIAYLDGLTGNIQSQINGISVTDPITGNIYLPVKSGTAGSIVFEGSDADDYELTLSPGAGPSSDVTVVIPSDVSTTLVGIDNVQTLKNKTFEYPNQVYAGLTGYTSIETASGTTTLTTTSSNYQIFTGTLNQKVKLPATNTLVLGQTYHIVNNTTAGTLTVITNQTSPEVNVITIPAGSTAMVTCISIAGFHALTEWEYGLTDFSTSTGTGSVVLGTSPVFATSIDGGATFNAFASSTTLNIGASSGTTSVLGTTIGLSNATTLNINGASPTLASTSTGTLTLFNTNLTTVNAFGVVTTFSALNNVTNFTLGGGTAATGTYNLFGKAVVSTSILNLWNGAIGTTISSTANIATNTITGTTASSTVNIATGANSATSGITNVNIGTGALSGGATSTIQIGSTSNTASIRLNVPTGTTVGTAGAGTALPATPVGYMTVNVSGTNYKIPYYNV